MNNLRKIDDSTFVEFIYDLIGREDDFFKRSILVTPYQNGHSHISGFVITVAGSPPKATILFMLDSAKFITTSSPVKEYNYGDSYIRLTEFLKSHGIDEYFKVRFFE